jgi:hypothetical protein
MVWFKGMPVQSADGIGVILGPYSVSRLKFSPSSVWYTVVTAA